MSKHTPGPWEALYFNNTDDGGTWHIDPVNSESNYDIAVIKKNGMYGLAERRANAKLISCAPEMLVILKKLFNKMLTDKNQSCAYMEKIARTNKQSRKVRV